MGNGNKSIAMQPSRCRWPPNPSWGTGTQAHVLDRLAVRVLLTPHGERELVFEPEMLAVEYLLTPHGERELEAMQEAKGKLENS